MADHAERGMSAPPEVVFNTATDPDRLSAWLPEKLRRSGDFRVEVVDAEDMRARWGAADWSAEIGVRPADAGGARVRLDLAGPDHGTAEEILASLDREVADNLTAG
ncbi:hypothetical protein [Micromonospora sp. DT31]|uniref:hypothetical protein n=1 Tax=Micromonospora sp. DT31 TaxID=3393434 RepID=UPI003CF24745